jgi:hypothetical protein
VSAVKYELAFYIPEDDILHSHRRENLRSYPVLLILCSLTFIIMFIWLRHKFHVINGIIVLIWIVSMAVSSAKV